MSEHPCHKSEISKLNRIGGQVEGIKRMIDGGRYCPDILTQLRAVRAALKTVELNVLEHHMQSCVADAMKSGSKAESDEKIAELKDIMKRFQS